MTKAFAIFYQTVIIMANPNDRCEQLLLDNQLCFPLYVCGKEIVNAYTPYLSKLGLTYTQYITMMVMWEEKQVTSGHLKERLFLDSGTLTPVLRRLEKKGYIMKERSREDARDLVITLTETGRQLKAEATEIPFKVGSCLNGFEHAPELYALLREMMNVFRARH